jgi:pimeloyl-ACP methyl ester carboxylesterase
VTALHVERTGSGPPVVLVHGSVAGAEVTWQAQRPLAERWTLVLVDRPGYGPNPPVAREDFEADARLVAELLADGVHLVGQSYGGVVSLLAAALRPDGVCSLTVIEPPAFAVAAGHGAVVALVARLREHWENGPRDPAAFLGGFLELVGSALRLPDPLPPPLQRGAEILRVHRAPWEAEIPLDELAAAPFPKLVVSGAHHPAFDAVCDVLEQRLGAERAVLPGARHSVQRAGGAFNVRLEEFLRAAEAQWPQLQMLSPR